MSRARRRYPRHATVESDETRSEREAVVPGKQTTGARKAGWVGMSPPSCLSVDS